MHVFSKAKIFLILCLAFIIGVGMRSIISVPAWLMIGIAAGGGLVTMVFRRNKYWRLVGTCCLLVVFGILRYNLSVPRVDERVIQFYNGQTIRFAGLVTGEPDVRQDHVRLTVTVAQTMAPPRPIGGKVLIKTFLYPEYRYGDLLDVTCKLQTPTAIDDFAYDRYLARYSIYSVCYRPTIRLIAHDQGNLLLSALLTLKSKFIAAIQQALPEPQASFLGGLILGAKKSIPADLMEAFSRTGTTHIVALSGYNITIIAVMILNICRYAWLSRRKSFWVSLSAIAFFVAITGAQASVIRAGIMGLLVLLARELGRMSRVTNALVLAAVAMVLINPKVLVFDTGFQLSFLATMGLVYFSPILEKFLSRLPEFFSIKSNATATLSATAMTMPLIMWQFGRLSLVAPLVNVLILPAIPLAMGLGFITGVFALVWLPLGQAFGWLSWTILSYVIFTVETFSHLPFAAVNI